MHLYIHTSFLLAAAETQSLYKWLEHFISGDAARRVQISNRVPGETCCPRLAHTSTTASARPCAHASRSTRRPPACRKRANRNTLQFPALSTKQVSSATL